MSSEPQSLKYMGTQSQETVNMAAALAATMAKDAVDATDRAAEAVDDFSAKVENASRGRAVDGSKISHAAGRAMGKATDVLQAAANQVRKRAASAAGRYTRQDPVRAILIAAGAGALLMSVIAMMARSGARTVKRNMER